MCYFKKHKDGFEPIFEIYRFDKKEGFEVPSQVFSKKGDDAIMQQMHKNISNPFHINSHYELCCQSPCSTYSEATQKWISETDPKNLKIIE